MTSVIKATLVETPKTVHNRCRVEIGLNCDCNIKLNSKIELVGYNRIARFLRDCFNEGDKVLVLGKLTRNKKNRKNPELDETYTFIVKDINLLAGK